MSAQKPCLSGFSAALDAPCRRAVPIVILAAGASSRMGRPKALLRYQHQTLLRRLVVQARQLTAQVDLVMGAGYPGIRYRSGAVPSRWLLNAQWHTGMASSLQCAIAAQAPQVPGVMVWLLDQPAVPFDHLAQLYQAASACPGAPVATRAGGRLMVPAYLPRRLWPAVNRLTGDQGARSILRQHQAVEWVCDAAALDVDTPEQWQAFVATNVL